MITPKVTVLMPVYNGDKYLREAIDSILNQTFTDFELLIIDDGSTDDSVAIIESFTDLRVRLVKNVTNLGLIASLNKGIDFSRGTYIARMDQDDISLPERLHKQVFFLDSNKYVDVCGTGIELIDCNGNCLKESMMFPAQDGFFRWCLCFYSPIAHPTAMIRKKTVVRVGGYAAEALNVEDYDLWRRLSKVTQLSNLPEVLLKLRKHNTNITKIFLSEHLISATDISKLIIADYINENIDTVIVQIIWAQATGTTDDVVKAGRLIHKLYYAAIANEGLTREEKLLIRKDSAMRLDRLIYHNRQHILLWKLLPLVLDIYPLYAVKVFLKTPYRIGHNILLKFLR